MGVRSRPLSGPPHIVQLLGIYMTPHEEHIMYLVRQLWGRDLRCWQTVDATAFGPQNLRDVFIQIVGRCTRASVYCIAT